MQIVQERPRVTRLSLDALNYAELAGLESIMRSAVESSENALPPWPFRHNVQTFYAVATLRSLRMTYLFVAEEVVRRCDYLMARQSGQGAGSQALRDSGSRDRALRMVHRRRVHRVVTDRRDRLRDI